MTDLGLGLGEYSVLLTINGGMLCLLQIPAIGLFQRMSNTRVLVLGMSITAVGYAFQIGANSWVTFAIATVLWTLGELGTFPIAATTVANIAPKDVRGTYQGLYNLVWSLSNAFSPLVGGWNFERVRQSRAVDLLHGDVRNCGDWFLRDARPPRTRRSPQSCDGGTVAVALRRWRAVDTPPNFARQLNIT